MIYETAEQWLGKENEVGKDIWKNKYKYKNETFMEWVERVSQGDIHIQQLILERKFLPGGRIMSNIGIEGNKAGMMNCYSRGFIEDDYEDIMQALVDIGKTFKAEGGQGLSLSKLRPKGAPVGTEYESDGIIPFMRMYNEVTAGTSQGGSRKGALMMSLDAWHKEAMNFITIKSTEGEIEKANLSLEVDNEFMEAVKTYYETGEILTVHRKENYSGHIVEWDVTPIDVFKAFIKNNWEWGDPGCLFVDEFRNYNIMEYVDGYNIETSNPCGEQPLPKNFCCNLASLNLSEFVLNPYTPQATFDATSFKQAIPHAVRYLDDIVDLNAPRHPLYEQRINSLNYRNIGLGVFGYASMLMKMGLKYGDKEALSITDQIFDVMFRKAVFASSELAEMRGSFPKYSEKVWDSEIIKNHFNSHEIESLKSSGLRNCSLLSIAPTGSIATMLNESGGCEPEYAISYTRRTVGLTNNEDNYYKVYCKCAREFAEMYDTDDLPDYFVGSADIDPSNRVATQAVMQKHVDTAISSTVNLPSHYTEEQMAEIYIKAWEQGLKGITIFRDGCKRAGILTTGTTTETQPSDSTPSPILQRGDIIDCSNDLIGKKRKLTTGCGSLHILAYFDPYNGDMMEIYLNKGSTGGCANFTTGLSRMISLLCRAGVDVYTIKDQLNSTGACPSYATRSAIKRDTSKGSCCPMAVGNALIDMYEEMKLELDTGWENTTTLEKSTEPTQNKNTIDNNHKKDTKDIKVEKMVCPECDEVLSASGGCSSCQNCGWSKCD